MSGRRASKAPRTSQASSSSQRTSGAIVPASAARAHQQSLLLSNIPGDVTQDLIFSHLSLEDLMQLRATDRRNWHLVYDELRRRAKKGGFDVTDADLTMMELIGMNRFLQSPLNTSDVKTQVIGETGVRISRTFNQYWVARIPFDVLRLRLQSEHDYIDNSAEFGQLVADAWQDFISFILGEGQGTHHMFENALRGPKWLCMSFVAFMHDVLTERVPAIRRVVQNSPRLRPWRSFIAAVNMRQNDAHRKWKGEKIKTRFTKPVLQRLAPGADDPAQMDTEDEDDPGTEVP